jgi:hypothetical protein
MSHLRRLLRMLPGNGARRLALEKPGQMLQATAPVNKAFLRLVACDADRRWDGCGHFFAAAARLISGVR